MITYVCFLFPKFPSAPVFFFLGILDCSQKWRSSTGRFSQIWLWSRYGVQIFVICLLYFWLQNEIDRNKYIYKSGDFYFSIFSLLAIENLQIYFNFESVILISFFFFGENFRLPSSVLHNVIPISFRRF